MVEAQEGGVQGLPGESDLGRAVDVFAFADERVTGMGGLDADLVAASGLGMGELYLWTTSARIKMTANKLQQPAMVASIGHMENVG